MPSPPAFLNRTRSGLALAAAGVIAAWKDSISWKPSFWALAAVIPDRGLDQQARWFARAVRSKMEEDEAKAKAANDNPRIARKSRIILP